MTIRNEVLDELLKDYKNPEDLVGGDPLAGWNKILFFFGKKFAI